MGNEEKAPGRSKESLVGIWVGKQIKPELEVRAKQESERTGIDLSANGLAKEIFLWAYAVYVEAGSLAAMKKTALKAEFKKGRKAG